MTHSKITREQIERAAAQLQAELQANAGEIGRIMDAAELPETRPMRADELGRFVCVPASTCLHDPDITIWSSGVWVKSSPGPTGNSAVSSSHADCHARRYGIAAGVMPEVIMEYTGPVVMLPTPVGIVRAVWTDGGHCHVSAYGDQRGGSVDYAGSNWYVHLDLYGAHGWGEDPELKQYRSQFTTTDSKRKVITAKRRGEVVGLISQAVREYVRANPEISRLASANDLDHKIESEAKTLAEMDAARAELSATLAMHRAERRLLDGPAVRVRLT